MKESTIVSSVKNYLIDNGWHLMPNIAGKIKGQGFRPDIVAKKAGKRLSVECKGDVDLNELSKGIGQCIQHQYYGSNIIYLAVPEAISEQSKLMLKTLTLSKGKIGLFAIGPNKEVRVVLNKKEINSVPNEPISESQSISRVNTGLRNEILKMILLLYLEKHVEYPYSLLKSLRARKISMLESMTKNDLYNALNSLEKQGLIKGKSLKMGLVTHRHYRLTLSGREIAGMYKKNMIKSILEVKKFIERKF